MSRVGFVCALGALFGAVMGAQTPSFSSELASIRGHLKRVEAMVGPTGSVNLVDESHVDQVKDQHSHHGHQLQHQEDQVKHHQKYSYTNMDTLGAAKLVDADMRSEKQAFTKAEAEEDDEEEEKEEEEATALPNEFQDDGDEDNVDEVDSALERIDPERARERADTSGALKAAKSEAARLTRELVVQRAHAAGSARELEAERAKAAGSTRELKVERAKEQAAEARQHAAEGRAHEAELWARKEAASSVNELQVPEDEMGDAPGATEAMVGPNGIINLVDKSNKDQVKHHHEGQHHHHHQEDQVKHRHINSDANKHSLGTSRLVDADVRSAKRALTKADEDEEEEEVERVLPNEFQDLVDDTPAETEGSLEALSVDADGTVTDGNRFSKAAEDGNFLVTGTDDKLTPEELKAEQTPASDNEFQETPVGDTAKRTDVFGRRQFVSDGNVKGVEAMSHDVDVNKPAADTGSNAGADEDEVDTETDKQELTEVDTAADASASDDSLLTKIQSFLGGTAAMSADADAVESLPDVVARASPTEFQD